MAPPKHLSERNCVGMFGFSKAVGFLFSTLLFISMGLDGQAEAFERIMFVETEADFEGGVELLDVSMEGEYVSATVRLPYLDIRGESAAVQARAMARFDRLASGVPMPAFCHVYYEPFIDEIPGPEHWCDLGWLVVFPHYPPSGDDFAPEDLGIANGVNHTRAMIQWVRRLSCVDRQRIHLNGASQAGYMVLAAAASSFPVTSATSFYPVVNWGFNLQYFEANRVAAGYPETPPSDSPMPVVANFSTLVEMPFPLFGPDLAGDAYYAVSPIAYPDRVTGLTLVVCATGDMLVPVGQMNPEREAPFHPEIFPNGYRRDFEDIMAGSVAHQPFEHILDRATRWIREVSLPEGIREITREEVLGRQPLPAKDYLAYVDLPWSPDHQWSLVYLDEGPPTPHVGHTRYHWRVTFDDFIQAHRQDLLPLELLTMPKLEEMLERYAGQQVSSPLLLAEGVPLNRRNFEGVERFDILTGLLDYATASPDHGQRLEELYEAMPDTLKSFGPTLTQDHIEEALERLSLYSE